MNSTKQEVFREVDTPCHQAFINRETLEIRTILAWDNMYGDTELWDEELEKIQPEWADYIILEKMTSKLFQNLLE